MRVRRPELTCDRRSSWPQGPGLAARTTTVRSARHPGARRVRRRAGYDEVRVACPTRRSGRGVASPMGPRVAAVLPAPSALEATRHASGLDGRGIRLRVLAAPALGACFTESSPFASGLRPMQECRYAVLAMDSLGHLCRRDRGRRCDEPVCRNGAGALTE